MHVPLDDLARQYQEIESEAMPLTQIVWSSGRYVLTQGVHVAEFEQAFAETSTSDRRQIESDRGLKR
jgi:hypothetical protein